jgi:hypothetical protein
MHLTSLSALAAVMPAVLSRPVLFNSLTTRETGNDVLARYVDNPNYTGM